MSGSGEDTRKPATATWQGVGYLSYKTTTAINLGAALASQHHKNVLLIDIDMQAHLTFGMGVDPYILKATMYDVLTDRSVSLEDAIRNTAIPNLDILPAHPRMVEVSAFLSAKIDRPFYLRNALRNIVDSKKYHYVIIDCPPQLDVLFANAMLASTDVIIPIQPEAYALEGVSSLTKQIVDIKEGPEHAINLMGALITLFNARTNLHQIMAEEIKKYFGHKCFKTIVPINIAIAEASTLKIPVLLHQKKSKGALAYLSLAREVLDEKK